MSGAGAADPSAVGLGGYVSRSGRVRGRSIHVDHRHTKGLDCTCVWARSPPPLLHDVDAAGGDDDGWGSPAMPRQHRFRPARSNSKSSRTPAIDPVFGGWCGVSIHRVSVDVCAMCVGSDPSLFVCTWAAPRPSTATTTTTTTGEAMTTVGWRGADGWIFPVDCVCALICHASHATNVLVRSIESIGGVRVGCFGRCLIN